jgi:raffinose/stachyose/melibiose transport system permease protein
VVIAFTWKWIYHPFVGVLNSILEFLHLSFLTQSWLGDPKVALLSTFFAYTWGSLGYSMVIYLSGLQTIDTEIFDAATVDGVNFFQRLLWITVPMLRDVTTFVISLRILTAMGVFEVIYNMTGGGPYYASNVIGIYMYNMLRNQEMGWGTAAATINAIIVVSMSIGFIRWREKNT